MPKQHNNSSTQVERCLNSNAILRTAPRARMSALYERKSDLTLISMHAHRFLGVPLRCSDRVHTAGRENASPGYLYARLQHSLRALAASGGGFQVERVWQALRSHARPTRSMSLAFCKLIALHALTTRAQELKLSHFTRRVSIKKKALSSTPKRLHFSCVL